MPLSRTASGVDRWTGTDPNLCRAASKLVAQIDRHDADTAYEVSGIHFVKGGQEDSCAMLTALAQSSGVEVGEHSVLHALLLGHGGQGEQVRSGPAASPYFC